jgi:hypothetical protein
MSRERNHVSRAASTLARQASDRPADRISRFHWSSTFEFETRARFEYSLTLPPRGA